MSRFNKFIWSAAIIALFLFVTNSSEALNQLTNSHFDTNSSGWDRDERLTTFSTPSPVTAIDDDMSEWDRSGNYGGSYRVRKTVGGWLASNDRDVNSVLSQPFSTPADPVKVRVRFDHIDIDSDDYHWIYGSIRDNAPTDYPNENIVLGFFSDTSASHPSWTSNTYDVSNDLAASSNYIYRIYWYYRVDRNSAGDSYVDNLRVDFSPTGLSGAVNGTSNEIAWNTSTTSASDVSLRGTNPYKIYWGTTSGSYTASSAASLNSFSHTPPAGSVVYYVVTDFDSDDVESPYSVECPIVRMTVNDGSGADVDTIIGADVDMNWSHVAVTGFTRTGYQVALGSTPGGSDVADWIDLGAAATSYTFTNAGVTSGNTYYTSVRMVTNKGTLNYSASDGFVAINLDVRDGSGADVDFTTSLTAVAMNWGPAPFTAGRYHVALGTTPGGTEVAGWTNVNLATSHSFTSLSLSNGTSYYCSVRAYDAGMSEISVFSSNGFTPVLSSSLNVYDGSDIGVDADDIFSLSDVDLNWQAAAFSVVRYEAALGTVAGGNNIADWTDMGTTTSGTLSGLTLATGTTYFCSVRIVHAMGTLPSSSSDGFKCRRFEVRDGLGEDIDYTFAADTLHANWNAVTVSFLRYEAAVGTTPGGTDVVGWTSTGTSTNVSFSGLTLVGLPTMYYVSVRLIGMGGNPITTAFSDGVYRIIVVDIPVRDGLNPDIEFSFFENRAEMNWDHPPVGIIRYEVALGTSKFSDNVHPFTDVGHARRAALTGLSLASGTRYFATVRGVGPVGEVEAFGSSNGFIACRDQVLVDTASQTYFHNARVLRMIDTTTDAGSIRPKIFSASGGRTYARYMPVTVTEPGVTERINAPCRIQLAGLSSVVANAIRVADDQGNELPRYVLSSNANSMDLVFLVNMAKSETKTYWVYWDNGSATSPGAYGFTDSATNISATEWTPYYSRKNMAPGSEDVTLGARLSGSDDALVSPGNLPWAFYFFGDDFRAWRMHTNGFLCENAVTNSASYRPRWAYFTGADRYNNPALGRTISPLWSDLWPGGGSPQDDGIYHNVFADRVVYTWRANRFGVRDDIYIFQAVLYQSSDIALKYSYLSTLGIIGPAGSFDMPVNTENTVGISRGNGSMWLINTPLIIGIGKSPTAFYQCSDAFRGKYAAGPAMGGAGWVEVAHIESMIFDSRTANPLWQRIEYDCAVPNRNRLVISTRSGSTPLPEMGGWTGWVPTATVTSSGNAALNSTDRYIQYRVGFERNRHNAALAVLNEVRFVHGGISIEEVKANTPEGVAQGQSGIPVEVTIKNFYTNPVNLQSVELTFSLGTYIQTLVAPAIPGTQIPAGGTITATFLVDVDINSPVGSATVDALATATVGGLTFYDGDAQTPHKWRVRSRANLSILKVETEPTFVNKGQADILVNMLIANLGETPYYFNGASLTFSLGTYEPQVGSLTSPIPVAVDSVEIPPLSEFTAVFTVKISPTSDSGFVAVIGGTASGTDKFSGRNTDDLLPDVTDSWTIQNPASLVLEEVIASETVYRGQTNTPVFLRVSNMGEATAIWEYSDLLVPPYFATGTYDACYSITPFDITLPGYMEATAHYGIDISPTTATCTDAVNANIYGSDENTGGVLKWESGALLPATWTIRAEKLNTFKDPVYAFPSDSFNKPTAGNVTVYARGENVNPYDEYVFRWIDDANNTVLVSVPLTSDASGTMYHQFDITPASAHGNYKVQITNPTNTIIAVENVFEVTSPAVLSGLFKLPAQVSVGQPFVGSMTFVNTGGAKVESGYASALDLNTALLASLDAGPDPAVIDVEGENQATATYQFTALALGNFSASATVYGFDANAGTFLTSSPFLSNTCLIQTAPSLTILSVNANPTVVYLNQKNLRVEVVIRNGGQATAVLEAASLTFDIGQYSQSILSPEFPYELAGNNTTVTIIYDISVNPDSPTGDDTITANLLWHDKNWPENGGYLTGAPPQHDWTINPIGIKLAANLSYTPLQDDFSRGQTVYIRCYGFAPLAQWYRVRLYNYELPQPGNSPLGWINCSPQLSADGGGYVDHLYTLLPADALGTWTAVIDSGSGTTGGAKQSIQYFRVQRPGGLIASLTISPTEVFVGEEFTVTMLASNTVDSGSTISNASPAMLLPSAASAGSATLLSGPTPASATIKAGETRQFVWTYRADANTGLVGSYSLTVAPSYYAAGYDLNTDDLITSNKAVSNRLLIYSRDLGLSSDTLDFGVMECGDNKMIGPTQILNLGNYQLDMVKWITTDLNGLGMLKISKSNLSMSPTQIGGIAAGSAKNATATLFIPYNKEDNNYAAVMSVFQDLNSNNIFDLGELYDSFAVKVTVPPCKRVFAVQEIVDLGGWGTGETTLSEPLNIFNGGNLAMDNVKMMVLPGATNTFAINVNPAIYGPMAIAESFVASVSAINVVTEGFYIATWTVWDDSGPTPDVVEPSEASDTFQVHIRVGTIDFTLAPASVNGGILEPSAVNSGFGLTLTNTGTLPLAKLRFDPQPLINTTSDVIASESVAIDGTMPSLVGVGDNVAINFALFAPAAMATGTYSSLQYFYYDDNLNGKWDAGEYRKSFTLQVEVILAAKVLVLASTVGLGGIMRGTTKMVSFNCRNTGNLPLTGMRWEKTLLRSATDTIPVGNASFPPSELFSVPPGQFFTRQIAVTAPVNATFGVYNSIPNHYWLFADMPPTINGIRNPSEAQSNFMVHCEVGELKVAIDDPSLSSTGDPNSMSSPDTFTVRNIGTLGLSNLKATASVLLANPPGPLDIPAANNLISSIGALNAGQFRQPTWRVIIPPNASATSYLGTLTVWDDANNNGINESAEASATVPIELIVNSARMIDVTTTLLDLEYVGRNNSKSRTFEIRNVGNLDLTNLFTQKAALVFGSYNIPVGSITLLLPATSLAVGNSMVATATVTIGPIQGSYTYNGTQVIFDDHLVPLGSFTAGEASDTFVLRVSVGDKKLYETNPTNPPLDFAARNVNTNPSLPITVYNSNPVPLPNVRWQVLSPLTGSLYTFPVASLSFAPAGEQSLGATPANYTWNANLSIGSLVPAGSYIATAAFYDDEINNNILDNSEASATFNVLLSVNATHSLVIVDSVLDTELDIVDFGEITQGASKSVDVTFRNTSNVTLSDFSWSFIAINGPSTIDSAQISYSDLPAPVAPGDYGTIRVTIDIPTGQTVGDYGPTAGQTLFADNPVAVSDGCEFQCKVVPSLVSSFEMGPGSAYQEIATETFASPAPDNMFFLSAWVCPGSGSADLSLIQYDDNGKALATAAIRVASNGNLMTIDAAPWLINHSGASMRVPVKIDGELFDYYRIFMAFELTYNPAVASDVLIVLQNSSPSGHSVWFDGIQLEKAFPSQTRPTSFSNTSKIHSPNKGRTLDGQWHYYEW